MEKVSAIMIVEMAGRPAEHVKNILSEHVGQIRNFKDVEVINMKVSEPKRLEAEQEAYTCFAEIEVNVETFLRLTELIFDFMPSSIEVLSPSNVKMESSDATSFLNNLAGRLHRYDEIAKIAQIRMGQMAAQLQGFQQQMMEKDAGKKSSSKSKEKKSTKTKSSKKAKKKK